MSNCTETIIGNYSLADLISKGACDNIPQKDSIIAYLRCGVVEAAAAGRALDIMTGERIPEEWLSYTDGTYHWDTSHIYHFDKYNIQLSEEFIQHVIACGSFQQQPKNCSGNQESGVRGQNATRVRSLPD